MNIKLSSIAVGLVLLSGCGTTGKFVYPAKMSSLFKSSGEMTSDKVVAILPFDDYRSDENTSGTMWLYALPLSPYGKVEYDRPDAATMFLTIAKYDVTPAEDLGKAAAVSFRHSKMFKDAFFTMGGEKDRADFVVSGRLKEMKYTGRMYSYCLSLFGPMLWYVGAPVGDSENIISYELEMKDKNGKVVWEYSFSRSIDVVQWYYYRMGDDCKQFSALFQDSMNEALENLASRMNSSPDLFR